jgi:uncharacterized protein YecA (UPF0149 family)
METKERAAEQAERIKEEFKEGSEDTERKLQKYGLKRKQVPVRMLKIGRNEECPCGSKLKYKKCHMLKYNKTNFDIRRETPLSQLEEMLQ